MKLRFCHFVLVLIFVLLSSSVIAQTSSTAISYQGTLDIAGVAADGMYDFRAVLYDSLEFGNQASDVIEILNVRVIEGLVNLWLDFGASIKAATPRFLQLEVRLADSNDAYTRLDPRQQLFSAPRSVSADTLNGDVFQRGTIGTCASSGSAGSSGSVVFPKSYSQTPLVFLTPDESFDNTGCFSARVTARSNGGFSWLSLNGAARFPCDCIHWLAIGPL